MKKYKAYLIGYDTCNWHHTTKQIEVDSEQQAREWCDENSYMGGYD